MITTVIVACELGFWVLLSLGLATRYLLRWQRLSTALLLSVPLVDLVLLVVTVLDLSHGATANLAHAAAALYLGFSIAFGHQTISRADAWFAHRFAGGPKPPSTPRRGPEARARAWSQWRRTLVAWLVSSTLLLAAVLIVGDSSRTAAFVDVFLWSTVALVLSLIAPLRHQFSKKFSKTRDR